MRCVLVALLCLFAPVPFKDKPAPAIKEGAYVMTWRGVDAPTYFWGEGDYHCHWQGRWWEGRWSQEKGTLRVEEWPVGEPDTITRWAVRLGGPTEGTLDGDSEWKLVPAKCGPVMARSN